MFDMNASMFVYVKTEIKKPEINYVGVMNYSRENVLFVPLFVKIFNHLIGDIG